MEKFGQYILIHKVGSGGMAELFKAKKIGIEGFERILAIKRILPHLSSDEEFIKMFIAEAKLAARLNHKNIAQIYDFGKTGQNYYIAMEYIRGKDLKSILKKCRGKNISLPEELAIFVGKEAASALHSAHNQKDNAGKNLNIIHRDVSPQNILVSYEGEVKVVDFGIAKAETQSKTLTGVLKGKLSYMSPEQAWGKSIDHRSDIFSLGSVLYEMLTGEKLFAGSSELDTLEKVREANVAALLSSHISDITPVMEKKLLKALEKDATCRYQNASDMEKELGRILFREFHVEPIMALKKFMHELFEREIEAELRSDMEDETVLTMLEEETLVALSKGDKSAGAAEGPVESAGLMNVPGFPRTKKWEIVPYAITISLALIFLVGSFFIFPLSRKSSVEPRPASEPAQARTPMTTQAPVPESVPPETRTEVKPTAKAEPGTKTKPKDGLKTGPEARVQARIKTRIKIKTSNRALESPEWKGKRVQVSHKFGMLAVNASPWGEVYLNGIHKGSTPLTIDKVPAGRHQLRVAREGFSSFNSTVDIKEGETEKISANLKRE